MREGLIDWAFDPLAAKAKPRIVIVQARQSDAIVGVVAHESARLGIHGGATVEATQLVLIALARRWQGKAFTTGERASDVLMSAAITDIQAVRPPRSGRVFAKIHRQNLRSIALCARYGLTHPLRTAHRDYICFVNENPPG